jgi:hypothetical protein
MRPARVARAVAVAAVATGTAGFAAGGAQVAGHRAGPDPPGAAARAAASVMSGSFSQLNSRAGLSIFRTDGLAPGAAVTGSVTVTNAGTLGGRFTLSAADLSDTPGSGGGRLSERLGLAVVDVTAPTSPRTVYSGRLAAMAVRPLGHLRAGEARRYRFTASLPDGGAPPSPTSGDNAYAGSSTHVRFVWDAIAEAPPAVPAPAARGRRTARDRRPPRLRLSIPRVQHVFSLGYLTVRARCDERCRLDVSGTVRVGRSGRALRAPPIRGARGAPGRPTPLRVRIPARMHAPMRRSLLRRGTVTVRLTLTARDRVGNRTVARRTVRLHRR